MPAVDQNALGELLSAYLDGALSPKEVDQVERLLRKDESARKLLSELKKMVEAVGSLPRHCAPPSVAEDLRAAMERQALLNVAQDIEAVRWGKGLHFSRWLSLAAMLAIAAFGGWWAVDQDVIRKGFDDLWGERDATSQRVAEGEAQEKEFPSLKSEPVGSVLLASATFTQKQQAGLDTEQLLEHQFEKEAMRLRIPTSSLVEQTQVAAELQKRLASRQAQDMRAEATQEKRPEYGAQSGRDEQSDHNQRSIPGERLAGSKELFFEGKAGVNFSETHSRQVLVQVPVDEVEALTENLAPRKRRDEVDLQVADLNFRGSVPVQSALRQMRGADPQGLSSPSSSTFSKSPVFSDSRNQEHAADTAHGPFDVGGGPWVGAIGKQGRYGGEADKNRVDADADVITPGNGKPVHDLSKKNLETEDSGVTQRARKRDVSTLSVSGEGALTGVQEASAESRKETESGKETEATGGKVMEAGEETAPVLEETHDGPESGAGKEVGNKDDEVSEERYIPFWQRRFIEIQSRLEEEITAEDGERMGMDRGDDGWDHAVNESRAASNESRLVTLIIEIPVITNSASTTHEYAPPAEIKAKSSPSPNGEKNERPSSM